MTLLGTEVVTKLARRGCTFGHILRHSCTNVVTLFDKRGNTYEKDVMTQFDRYDEIVGHMCRNSLIDVVEQLADAVSTLDRCVNTVGHT